MILLYFIPFEHVFMLKQGLFLVHQNLLDTFVKIIRQALLI